MRWWLVLVVGCGGDDDWHQPPVPGGDDVPAGACVGYGEGDEGDDGSVETYFTHVVADTWDELTASYPADLDLTQVTRKERDERGDPVREVYEGRNDGELFRQVTTWERDDEGREIVKTVVGTDTLDGDPSLFEGEARYEYTWDGPLLDRIDHFWGGEIVQATTHGYDAAGRLVEQLLTPGLLGGPAAVETHTQTYFAPAPSIDHHFTQDTNSDGLLEVEGDRLYDPAGRILLLSSTGLVGGVSTWTREYTYDELGREVRTYEESDSPDSDAPPIIAETLTTWDPDGHVLEVFTSGTWGSSRTTWSWTCP